MTHTDPDGHKDYLDYIYIERQPPIHIPSWNYSDKETSKGLNLSQFKLSPGKLL